MKTKYLINKRLLENNLFYNKKKLYSFFDANFKLLSTKQNNGDGLVRIDDNYENKFIRKIVMENEKQRNSLGLDMIRSLQNAVNTIDLEKCRVLVISSSSLKVFSSGNFKIKACSRLF